MTSAALIYIFIFILLEAEKFLLSGPSFIIHYTDRKHNTESFAMRAPLGARLKSLKR